MSRTERLLCRRIWLLAGVIALPLVVPGCAGSSAPVAYGTGGDSTALALNDDKLPEELPVEDPAAAITPDGKSAHCPQVVAWPNERLLTIYQPGHDGELTAVIHRGELTKMSRERQLVSGRMIVKYGFAGRVLLGPKGKPGTVTMPISVRAAGASKETLATDRMSISATIPPGNTVGYFSMVRELTLPIQVGTRPEDYKIFVAFGKQG